jgi:hypothetical protein
MDTQTFNPANAKAKEIADKLMRARQRVAEQKGGNGSIFFSICFYFNCWIKFNEHGKLL